MCYLIQEIKIKSKLHGFEDIPNGTNAEHVSIVKITNRLNSIRRILQWETSITQSRRNITCNTTKYVIIIVLGISIAL
jgi:hypothetical protein